jgi:hypothetical protein
MQIKVILYLHITVFWISPGVGWCVLLQTETEIGCFLYCHITHFYFVFSCWQSDTFWYCVQCYRPTATVPINMLRRRSVKKSSQNQPPISTVNWNSEHRQRFQSLSLVLTTGQNGMGTKWFSLILGITKKKKAILKTIYLLHNDNIVKRT